MFYSIHVVPVSIYLKIMWNLWKIIKTANQQLFCFQIPGIIAYFNLLETYERYVPGM